MNPAYSLNNVLFVGLPGHYKFGGKPRSREQSVIALETDNGVEFVYKLFEKKTFELIFMVANDELDYHESFYLAVNGGVDKFYLSLNGTGSDSVYVRREPGFDPTELDMPQKGVGSTPIPMFNIVHRFKQQLL